MKSARIFAVVASAFAFGVANAEAREVVVSTATVDFSDPRQVLDLRNDVVQAAHRVCRGQGRVGLQERLAVKACVVESVEDALAQADRPALTALQAALPAKARFALSRPLTPSLVAAVEGANVEVRADLRLGAPYVQPISYR